MGLVSCLRGLASSELFVCLPALWMNLTRCAIHSTTCTCSCCLQKTTTVSTPTPSVGGTFSAGTYAYYVANSDTVDCKAVLKQWKDAYKNFEGLPPKYSAEAAVYQNPDNVSLVAMYNPLSGATADCRMVTCTKTVDSPSTTENGYGLMCMTSPDALQKASPKSPPFS